jgi:type III restriction enzyme
MGRVKDRTFMLNYYVDFTEKDFVSTLVKEVNDSSFKETVPSKLTQELKDKITAEYPDLSAFNSKLKEQYPKAFPTGVKPNKIKVG